MSASREETPSPQPEPARREQGSVVPFPLENPEESGDEAYLGYMALYEEVASALPVDAFSVHVVAPEGAVRTALSLVRTETSQMRRQHPASLQPAEQELLRQAAAGRPMLLMAQAGNGYPPSLRPPGGDQFASSMLVPLRAGQRPLGAILLQRRDSEAFGEDEMDMTAVLIEGAATTVRHLSLLAQVTCLTEQQRSLHTLQSDLAREGDLDELLRRALQHVSNFLQVPHAMVRMLEGGQLRIVHSVGFSAEYLRNQRDVPLAGNPHYQGMFLRREPLGDKGGKIWPEAKALGIQSLLNVPLRVPDTLLGVLCLASPSLGAFNHDARRYAELVGGQLAGAVINSGLRLKFAASEGRLRSFFDNTNDSILIANGSGLVTDWNDAATQLFGYSAEEIRGIHLASLFGGVWQSRIQQHLQKSSLTAPLVIPHTPLLRLDAPTQFTARATLLPLYSGNNVEPDGYSLIIRDVDSGDALAVAAAATGNDTGDDSTGGTAAGLSIGATLLGALATVRYRARPGIPLTFESVEGRIEELLGCTRRDLLADPACLDRVVIPEDRAEFRRRLEAPWRPGATVLEYRVKNPRGHLVLVQEAIVPVRGPQGTVEGLEGALIPLPVGRIARRIEGQERRRSLSTLAGGLAHELNNIGIGILSASSFALGLIDEEHPVARYLRIIERSGQRTRDLTDKLLLFSQNRRGRPTRLNVEAFLATQAIRLASWVCPGGMIRFEVEHGLPPIEADPELLGHALRFLVENAFEAQRRRDDVVLQAIRVQCDGRLADVDGPVTPGSYVAISVRDHGKGFTPEDRAALFEPFISSRGAGRGLGLAAAQGVVDSMGGCIGALSVEHQGAIFTIYIPARFIEVRLPSAGGEERQTTREDYSEVNATVPPARLGTVLLLDVDPLRRDLLLSSMRQESLHGLPAGGLAEAMALMRQQVGYLDAIYLDLRQGESRLDEPRLQLLMRDLRAINPLARVFLRYDGNRTPLLTRLGLDPSVITISGTLPPRIVAQAMAEALNS